MSKKVIIIVALGIIFAGFITYNLVASPGNLAGGKEKKEFEVMDEVGGFTLTEEISGEEALEQINYLHGKTVEIEEGYLLKYENGNETATVWISKSPTEEEASILFHQMNDIMGGSKMFTNHTEVEIGGMSLQYVFGMNMENYYYYIDERVIWIAITGNDTKQFMEAAIESF